MASEHPLVRLGDYVDACLGKMLDAQKNRGELQPYLGNSNVRWGSFDLADLSVMRFEDHEEERYGIRDGDLIVCEGGEPGRCAVWRGDAPMKIQKALHRVRTKAGLDNYFLYYWFLRAGSTGDLEPFFTGTTIKHLTGKALAELRIPLPPIESQREAAKVLRSLDDKIDLNRRINQTLEAMAQAIFKSWFVDFDPVKAKIAAIEEGRDPLHAAMSCISGKGEGELDVMPREQYEQLAATAALFPEEMEESELGEIPKGWEIWKVESLLSRLSAKIRYTKDQVSEYGRVPVFEQGASIILGYHNAPPFYQASSENPMFIFGDHTCITRLSYHPFDISQNVIPLQGQGRATGWVYYAVKDKQNFQEYRRHWMELISKNAVVADAETCVEFSKRIASLHLQIEANERQMQSLRQLRDTLLPKLLSGELSVEPLLAETTP